MSILNNHNTCKMSRMQAKQATINIWTWWSKDLVIVEAAESVARLASQASSPNITPPPPTSVLGGGKLLVGSSLDDVGSFLDALWLQFHDPQKKVISFGSKFSQLSFPTKFMPFARHAFWMDFGIRVLLGCKRHCWDVRDGEVRNYWCDSLWLLKKYSIN